ncbi:hypothetical protein DV738_g527, partial [Chaetothyriales sp. CBS 135597]
MSSISASPNPCLIAILLLTQARPGDPAQIIFHYPPDPFSLTKEEPDPPLSASSSSQPGDGSATTENWQPPWHPLLGLGTENLVSLLAPGRTWHKRKFEMAINDLTFVGRPVYARENGSWSRRRRRKMTETASLDSVVATAAADATSESDVAEDADEPTSPPAVPSQGTTIYVFIINLVQEIPDHVPSEIYDHVAKRLSKALKIEQAKHNYVWEQSELIQRLKAAHLTSAEYVDSFYSHVARQSALASAIVSTFRAISQSQVAAVVLSPRVSISMQIPPVCSASYLPSLTEPAIKPGLWLTTVNQAPSAHSDFDPASTSSTLQMAKNTTLLLHESRHKILRGLQEPQGPLARALTIFLDKLRSTKSFYALSIASRLSLADIQLLARHLIYWRHAVAIPPLHHRDTYIVSPNADMSKLASACKAFEASFPMTPSLPKILHLLSQTPIPYGRLIPSSDHKEEYYRMLAWLLRGGWVTQLCTFAYVRVDPRVKKAVRKPSHSSRSPAAKHVDQDEKKMTDEDKKTNDNTKANNDHNNDQTRLTLEQRQELRKYWTIFVKYFNGAVPLESIPKREGAGDSATPGGLGSDPALPLAAHDLALDSIDDAHGREQVVAMEGDALARLLQIGQVDGVAEDGGLADAEAVHEAHGAGFAEPLDAVARGVECVVEQGDGQDNEEESVGGEEAG